MQYDAHRGVWFLGVHHTMESDYFKNVRFPVLEFDMSFNYVLLFYLKTSEVKKILKASQRNNNRKISDQNKHLATYWLRNVMHSLTLQMDANRGFWLRSRMHTEDFFQIPCFNDSMCDAHHGVWLRGMMHTAESDSTGWCTLRSRTLFCDTLPIRNLFYFNVFL